MSQTQSSLSNTSNSTQALPLVSVIMPTYNTAPYIGRAIQSVLDQTYPQWELLIIDDASTDNTPEIVSTFTDSRIHYHRVERIGHPSGARNVGLRLAKGELLAFLDSDDMFFPEALAKLARPLLDDATLIASYGFAFEVDSQDKPLPQSVQLIPNPDPGNPDKPQYIGPPGYNHDWEQITVSGITCMLPALMLRRSAQQEIGFFNENLSAAEDYEFYVRMFLHNHQGVRWLSDYIYQYRLHPTSLTKAPEHFNRLLDNSIKIMDWLFNDAGIPQEAQTHKSRAYVACYRYMARERLLQHQPALTRQLAIKAFQDSHITKTDFLRQCGPLLVRSLLPLGLDSKLVRLRGTLRTWIHRKHYKVASTS